MPIVYDPLAQDVAHKCVTPSARYDYAEGTVFSCSDCGAYSELRWSGSGDLVGYPELAWHKVGPLRSAWLRFRRRI